MHLEFWKGISEHYHLLMQVINYMFYEKLQTNFTPFSLTKVSCQNAGIWIITQ